jgi:hypothetical protein
MPKHPCKFYRKKFLDDWESCTKTGQIIPDCEKCKDNPANLSPNLDGYLLRQVVAKTDLFIGGVRDRRKVLSKGRVARVVGRDGVGMLYLETRCGIIAHQRFWTTAECVEVLP